jgi:hypothetical protein
LLFPSLKIFLQSTSGIATIATAPIMHEIKLHPGIKYYISHLSGTLTYTFKLGDKPTRSFELHGDDFELSTSEPADDHGLNVAGTDISAVGLSITLVKNDGIIEMQYQGEDGNTAQ